MKIGYFSILLWMNLFAHETLAADLLHTRYVCSQLLAYSSLGEPLDPGTALEVAEQAFAMIDQPVLPFSDGNENGGWYADGASSARRKQYAKGHLGELVHELRSDEQDENWVAWRIPGAEARELKHELTTCTRDLKSKSNGPDLPGVACMRKIRHHWIAPLILGGIVGYAAVEPAQVLCTAIVSAAIATFAYLKFLEVLTVASEMKEGDGAPIQVALDRIAGQVAGPFSELSWSYAMWKSRIRGGALEEALPISRIDLSPPARQWFDRWSEELYASQLVRTDLYYDGASDSIYLWIRWKRSPPPDLTYLLYIK